MVFSLHVTTTKCNTYQALLRSSTLDTSLPRLCALKASVINCQLVDSINILDQDNTPSAPQLTSRSTVNKFAINAYELVDSWPNIEGLLNKCQSSATFELVDIWPTIDRLLNNIPFRITHFFLNLNRFETGLTPGRRRGI